jgi:hypothetical protein
MKKFIPCRKCNNKNGHYPEGYIITKDENGNEYVKECLCHIEWAKREHLLIQYQKANGNTQFFDYDIDKDYQSANNDTVVTWIKKYIEYFQKSERTRSAICYWAGTNNTQKTTIAYYVLKQLLEKNYKASYILMNTLNKLLMYADRDEEKQLEIETLSDIDLLIIDEAFDLNKLTIYKSGYQIPFLDTFIRNRINKNKGIIFISNEPIDYINKEKFGVSLIDLLKRQTAYDKSVLYFTSIYNKSKIDDKGLFS